MKIIKNKLLLSFIGFLCLLTSAFFFLKQKTNRIEKDFFETHPLARKVPIIAADVMAVKITLEALSELMKTQAINPKACIRSAEIEQADPKKLDQLIKDIDEELEKVIGKH